MRFARVVRNLGQMNVSAQLYDFVFAFPQTRDEDAALMEAISRAANTYFGVAFELSENEGAHDSAFETDPHIFR